MILFAVHAVLVWVVAFRCRRRFVGLAAVLAGAVVPALITRMPDLLRGIPAEWQFIAFGVELKLLFWAESAIVLGLGLFIVSLPRRPAHPHCPYCLYDLRGLVAPAPLCPECGGALTPAAARLAFVPRLPRGASSPIVPGVPAEQSAFTRATAATPPRSAAPAAASPPPAPTAATKPARA